MADQPVHELSREVVNLLVRARDAGESLSHARIREELALGHDELQQILGQLQATGMVENVAPGEYALADADAGEPERVPVAGEEDGGEAAELTEAQRAAIEAMRRRDGHEEQLPEGVAMGRTSTQAVRLTRAMVAALDDEALGKLVRAGVKGTQGFFSLEVG